MVVAMELADRPDSEASITRLVGALTSHINDESCARVRARALETVGRCIKTSAARHAAALDEGEEGVDEKTCEFEPMLAVIFRELVARYNDKDAGVLRAAAKTFTAVISSTHKDILAENIGYLRNQFNTVVSSARHRKGGVGAGLFLLPGLNQVCFLLASPWRMMPGCPFIATSLTFLQCMSTFANFRSDEGY